MTDNISPSPKPSLQERISQQDSWTFSECLGLSADYNVKVRMVIATVYSTGKTYVERDLQTSGNSSEKPSG